ncbi:MAG: GHKL domain-containing protein [Clostridia bacterium]|nr:GHKL domain-containing protein [Clostridia bacterium]
MTKWFGRTIFTRIFYINILTSLICLIILGSTQIVLLNRYISHQSEEALRRNAESVAGLIQNNVSIETMQHILNGFARSSNSHIMIMDSQGKVLINTHNTFMDRAPMYIQQEYLQAVLQGKRNSVIGTMGGLFRETMFTLQVPIVHESGGTLGAVCISIPIPQKQKMTHEVMNILMASAICVALMSFLLSYMLAKRFSRPIKSIQTSAKEFTKGKFNARVGTIATESEIGEIAELALTFNEMAFELEKVDEIRQSFISDVSHELRTPMTTISGFVYGMMDDTIPAERQKEYLKIVYDEVTRLSRLVNTFLDISRMRADQAVLNRTHFDINEAIRLVIIGLEQRIQQKKIQISLNFETENCYVYADSDAVTRVLTNLLDNAIKFTESAGEIRITVSQKQHEIFVSVYNTGCGIPSQEQPMIFERLYKVDKSRSANREGTGIGLYLVKNIIHAHGKKITLNSVEGEYAEFIFNLDRGKAPQKRIQDTVE